MLNAKYLAGVPEFVLSENLLQQASQFNHSETLYVSLSM